MRDATYQPTDRRPIKARGWWIWERTTHLLASKGISANAISVAGMFSGVLAGASLAATTTHSRGWGCVAWLAAAAFIQLRLLANLLDGMVAIESHKASAVGELYNEVPDRVSDTATIVGAGCAGGDVTLGFAAACVALLTAYIRAAGKAAGAPQQYCGPMAKPHRMALLTFISVYSGLAPENWQFSSDDSSSCLSVVGLWIIIVGGLITSVRRLTKIAAHLKGSPA